MGTQVARAGILLKNLPPVGMAVAYGSSVFPQANSYRQNNMLDMIVVVDDPKNFHEENLRRNPSHYSGMKFFGSRFLAALTDAPASVYYNAGMEYQGTRFKYGVISKDRLIADLLDWDVLYISGRMHKPVKFLTQVDPEIGKAQEVNLKSALHVALLTLPETFTSEDLFMRIAKLSYDGDFRMVFGEDKNKVSNIVRPNLERFTELYDPFLAAMSTLDYDRQRGHIHQDLCQASRLHHMELLPKTVQLQLSGRWRPGETRHRDVEEVLKSISKNHPSLASEVVLQSVRSIVRSSAVKQSLKGLLTTGPLTAVNYSLTKIKKMFSSLRVKQNP